MRFRTLARPCMLVLASELATCEMTRLMLPADPSILQETDGNLKRGKGRGNKREFKDLFRKLILNTSKNNFLF